ncbi:MAG: VWA domain-containing protein [Saprospiraceae bacterium]|nr:VWA domain-containing protein [Saprospiraceae bacterium]
MFKNFEFASPTFLTFLLLLPVIAWWYWQRYRTHYATLTFSNLAAFSGRSSQRGRARFLLPLLRGLCFVFLTVALARPQRILSEQDVQTDGIDIMIALDLSSSMLAQDFDPDRLSAAKRVAAQFVEKRTYDRVGLVVFSGEAFTQCPLTTDHSVVQEFLSKLQSGFLQDGTAIGMGLATSINRLKDSPVKSKIVILMTDGVNNAGYFKPEDAMQLAKTLGIKVYTIGVGSTGEALSPVGRRQDGKYVFGLVPVEIDETLLENIANTTGGKYYRATNDRELEQIYAEIDRLEKTRIDVTTLRSRTEVFGNWVLAALILIVLELVLRYTIFRTIP